MADLELARRDPRAFSAMLLGVPLTDWQARPLAFATFITCLVAGRQMGKSLTAVVAALWWALTKPDQVVVLAGASEDGARRLLRTALDLVRASPFAISLLEESASAARFSNGSRLLAPSASEHAIRGLQVDLAVADEAQLHPEAQWAALVPTLTAREGSKMLACGTASVSSGTFFNLAMQGLSGGSDYVKTERWVAKVFGGDLDAPWIRAEVGEAARASMSDLRWRAEFQGEFASGADSAFSRAWTDRVFTNYSPSSLAEFQPFARVHLGIDWGLTRDRSTAVAIGRFAGTPAFGVIFAHRWAAGVPIPEVVNDIATAPAHYDAVVAESVGLGGPSAQYLWRELQKRPLDRGGGLRRRFMVINPVDEDPFGRPTRARPPQAQGFATAKLEMHTTSEMKAGMFSGLRLLGDRGVFFASAADEELRRELLMLKVQITDTGTERIAASVGHDDLAMGLGLAALPRKGQRGAWTTRLSELADRASRLPEPDLPPGAHGMPTVETASGLAIPRTPVWQSVAGPEITLPAGFDRRRESPVIRDARERVRAAMEAVNQGG